jgi:predicted nucleotide-binding protein
MLLVRGEVEVPSDLDGVIFQTYVRSPIEREAEIRAFLAHVSNSNQ